MDGIYHRFPISSKPEKTEHEKRIEKLKNDQRRILVPDSFFEIDERPVIYLAGPINGISEWQSKAIEMILDKSDDIVIATPRIVLWEYITANPYLQGTSFRFDGLRPWEKYYMRRAAEGGTLLFWLPSPKPELLVNGVVYGATTRFELGEWFTRYSCDSSVNLVVGAEEDFPVLNNIRYDKKDLMGNDFMHTSLEVLVNSAIKSAYEKFENYKPMKYLSSSFPQQILNESEFKEKVKGIQRVNELLLH